MGECKYERCIVTQALRRVSLPELTPPRRDPLARMRPQNTSWKFFSPFLCKVLFQSLKQMRSIPIFPLIFLYLVCSWNIVVWYFKATIQCSLQAAIFVIPPNYMFHVRPDSNKICPSCVLLGCMVTSHPCAWKWDYYGLSVGLEIVGPMARFLIRVCVHVWASLFA